MKEVCAKMVLKVKTDDQNLRQKNICFCILNSVQNGKNLIKYVISSN
jgi:hypothetical protein